MDLILGIDPGVRGGAALISSDGKFIQTVAFHKLKFEQIYGWLLSHKSEIRRTFLEGVGARPTDGVVPAFKFGQNYGFWKGLLCATSISFITVYPLKWQTYMKCRTKGDKNITKTKAQELFPAIKITHAIADSLIIAEYGRRQTYDTSDL